MSHAETTGWSDNDCCRERVGNSPANSDGWREDAVESWWTCCNTAIIACCLPMPHLSGTVTVPSPTHSSVHCSPLSCCCPGRSLLCTSCNRTLAAEENGEDSHTSHRLTTSVTIDQQRGVSLRRWGGRSGEERGGGRGGEEQKVVPRYFNHANTHTLYLHFH